MDEAIWYFDGSMLDGKWKPFRSIGFGIVVATREGDLLAYGQGSPPSWCKTAVAAEAWALQMVLRLCPVPLAMRTDCLSLLHTLERGTKNATASSKHLARIWQMIAHATDGDLQQLARSERLVWMPAHQTLQAVGERKLSSGERLSFVDWRANRLADALAKASASENRISLAQRKLLTSAAPAVKHHLML